MIQQKFLNDLFGEWWAERIRYKNQKIPTTDKQMALKDNPEDDISFLLFKCHLFGAQALEESTGVARREGKRPRKQTIFIHANDIDAKLTINKSLAPLFEKNKKGKTDDSSLGVHICQTTLNNVLKYSFGI
ncbi:hypothetical protein CDAR_259761 [Caerostris darwini]|uniref:Uncharacterized protein n=1 Tax=Caerostris darwini TaxID=1538125 RepID=A0AAV4VPF5_9ARAC|nr:hypothetical protein CDAR_259761 [Caerostris darwini]